VLNELEELEESYFFFEVFFLAVFFAAFFLAAMFYLLLQILGPDERGVLRRALVRSTKRSADSSRSVASVMAMTSSNTFALL
jgi:hypothetical protein